MTDDHSKNKSKPLAELTDAEFVARLANRYSNDRGMSLGEFEEAADRLDRGLNIAEHDPAVAEAVDEELTRIRQQMIEFSGTFAANYEWAMPDLSRLATVMATYTENLSRAIEPTALWMHENQKFARRIAETMSNLALPTGKVLADLETLAKQYVEPPQLKLINQWVSKQSSLAAQLAEQIAPLIQEAAALERTSGTTGNSDQADLAMIERLLIDEDLNDLLDPSVGTAERLGDI